MGKRRTKNDELILVLNSGSSSLKFGVYRRGPSDEEALLTGRAEGVGEPNGAFRILSADGANLASREHVLESQEDALSLLASAIKEHVGRLPSAIGHRIVHGGPNLLSHQRITPQVLADLRAAVHFAPLHLPQALSLVTSAQSIFSSAAAFACFDDAFHRTLPEVASRLPLPKRFADRGIRRYGFHGLSYESLVHHFGEKLPSRAVFAHLGNGASLCALRNGRSVDTTMGLTPTGGIPMGTRSGDLDPSVLLYLLRNGKLALDELENMLNHESGLFALSSGESDVKALEERADSKDPAAVLALDIFSTSVRKTIGAYVALLEGIDLLVFTGGIGENSEYVRSRASARLEAIGLTAAKIQVVPTQEEKQIARHCRNMLDS